MEDAIRDQNHVTVALGVSSTDDTATTPFKVDPATGRLLVDAAAGGYTNLTQFVDQTPWRVFYSNTDGDVVELALGASGTVLTSAGASSAPTFSAAGAGDVSAAANLGDNLLIRGDGAAKGVQNSGITITDADAIEGATIDGDDNTILHIEPSTGLISGGILSVNADTAKFDISTGTGIVVNNYTDGASPTRTTVALGGTAIVVTDLATQPRTYVSVNSAGTVVQRLLAPTPSQRRDEIFLGLLVHQNNTVVSFTENESFPVGDTGLAVSDFMEAVGIINTSGNVISANGANLNINKSAGVMFADGTNLSTSAQDPNYPVQASGTALTFRYRYQNGSGGVTEGADTTVVDPDQYDDGDGGLAAVPNNKFTIQHVSVFTTGTVRIEYGQTVFDSLSDATAALGSETFTADPNLVLNASFRCWLIVKKGVTVLNSGSNEAFIAASKFGRSGASGATSSTTNLQEAYDNSVTPEILTDATRGALSVKRGSAADTDNVLEVQNAAGTNNFEVTGEGDVDAAGNMVIVGDVTGATLNATGDTAAGDNAAMGYTAAEGLILAGQGSTNDVTIKNDADTTVISLLTGTTDVLLTGDLLLGSGTGDKSSIRLNNSALADESWSGTVIGATAGATIAVGDLCYLNTAASEWLLTDGILDGTDSSFALKLGICVLASTDGNPTEILLDGVIASAAFPAFTVGAPVYMDDTAGNMVVAQPSTTNFAIRVIGEAVSATVLHFSPSRDYIVKV